MAATLSFIDHGNPLLEGVPEYTIQDWWSRIGYDSQVDWPRPFPELPESAIEEINNMIYPTTSGVQVACSLNTLLVTYLRRRDPRVEDNRRAIVEIARCRADPGKDLANVRWFPDGARGMILQGPTGCGKSHTVEAFCRQMPQVIRRDRSDECGWAAMDQVIHLRAFMPTDRSRSGLLLEIAVQLDAVLGTPYAEALRNTRWKLEQQIIYVLNLLMIHRVGLLILEEAQQRNLDALGLDFAMLFLRIMNCGVPLVMVGNPLAFQKLLTHSQDLRRLTDKGLFNHGPAYDHLDLQWSEEFAPKVWAWTVFNEPDEWQPEPDLLYRRSGGVPDYLVKYRRSCLMIAHRMGATSVQKFHGELAWLSPEIEPLHGQIKALVDKTEKGIKALALYPDWPVLWLQQQRDRELMIRKALASARSA